MAHKISTSYRKPEHTYSLDFTHEMAHAKVTLTPVLA